MTYDVFYRAIKSVLLYFEEVLAPSLLVSRESAQLVEHHVACARVLS